MSDKAKIVEGLHRVQTLLFDARDTLGDIILNRPTPLTVANVTCRIGEAEEILAKIMEEEFWA